MIKLMNLIEKPDNIFYRLHQKDQLKQGKIHESKVVVGSNLNELAIIVFAWYGGSDDVYKDFQLFKLKGIVEQIEEHTYQLDKTKETVSFCDQNHIDWELDMDAFNEFNVEYIIATINVPTIKIIEQIPIDNSIIDNIVSKL
jgi:hypothetical protein